MNTKPIFSVTNLWVSAIAAAAITLTSGLYGVSLTSASAQLYDEKANTRQDIEKAVERAGKEGKNVLITWGGNWCGWCHLLHETFESNDEINAYLNRHFVRVMADSRSNRALMEEMKVKPRGVPYLTVLDASGKKISDQATGPLEEGGKHDPEKVMAFLKQAAPKDKAKPADSAAETKLSAALKKLDSDDKRLFVKFSTESCGWCRRLDSFLADPAIKPALAKDYAFIEIDQGKLDGARTLRERLSGKQKSGGVPWFAILDREGNVLSTATGPQGNIGYPAEPEGIVHFMKMLEQTSTSMSPGDRSTVEAKLRELGKEYGY